MPVYDFQCSKCGLIKEAYIKTIDSEPPVCCDQPMVRQISSSYKIKMKYPLWVDRIDDIHKAQADRGERLRMPHPKEVRAT